MERPTTLTRSPYEIFNLTRWASDDEIKERYYELVKKYNPETHEYDFTQIRAAYDILRNPSSRASYDVRYFTGPPPLYYSDHPDYQEHTLSLFKLGQELKSVTGEDGAVENLQGEQKEQAVHILHGIALYHAKHENFEEARAVWKQILNVEPGNDKVRDNITLSYWLEGYSSTLHDHFEKAEQIFENMISQHGVKHGAAYQDLALAREKQGKKELADDTWRQTLNIYKQDLKADPDNEYLKALILAIHKYTGGKFLEGEAGSNIYGGGSSAKELGYACIQKGNWKQAVEALEEANRDNPNDIDVLCQLGWAYLNVNQHNKAFQMWNTAVKKAPGRSSVIDHLIRGHIVFGKRLKEQRIYNQALVQFKNVLKHEPNNLSVRMLLADTFSQMKNYAAAVTEYQKILEMEPRNKEAKQALREARRLGGLR